MEEFKEYTEYPIGTIVNTEYGKAIIYEHEKGIYDCLNCVFRKDRCSNRKCTSCDRKDKTSIYYKLLKEEEMEKGIVKLSLEDARTLYYQGGNFKTIALSAYSEEELTYIPKDGDFVTSSSGYPFIYKDFKANNNKRDYGCYLGKYVGDYGVSIMDTTTWTEKEGCRPSTEEEKQLLLSELHKIGKDWDPINKEIIPYKWKPELNKAYYTIYFSYSKGKFTSVCLSWTNDINDSGLYNKELVFKTKEEAEIKAKELNVKCNF